MRDRMGGFELEAWLIDDAARPAPVNEPFLAALDNPMVVPELARFNVELNDHPQHLWGSALSRFEASLGATWQRCSKVAAELNTRLLMIGILPTVREAELTQANMSDLKRYRALNEQVLRLREGRPLELDIHGREHLKTSHKSVMLEAATTSFQLHLKVHPGNATRAYNASLVLSAPMVAAAANSPYLFGHDLWDETRIPLFEQSVSVSGFAGASHGPMRRITFGSGYGGTGADVISAPAQRDHLALEPSPDRIRLRRDSASAYRAPCGTQRADGRGCHCQCGLFLRPDAVADSQRRSAGAADSVCHGTG
jgi:hypothetical protein